jgi:methylmalonyl-CoA mutase
MAEAAAPDLALAAEFPRAAWDEWRRLVERVLQGAAFESKLVARTSDGLRIEPLRARKADAVPVIARTPGAPWSVMQRLDHPEAAPANAQARDDMANGANALLVEFAGAIGARGYGLAAQPEAIARALEGVDLSSGATLDLDLGPQPLEAIESITALLSDRGAAPANTKIRFGLDPIGAAALTGGSGLAPAPNKRELSTRIADLSDRGFRGPFAAADARVVHDAGGSEVQELAYALAVAVQYFRALEAAGIALDAARRAIYFRMTADTDQLLTTAKFRALRKLWARIEAACGLAPVPAYVVADTAWRMMTRRDPYANILRITVAVVSAGLAGADAIAALPFTMALGLPDRFARRLARNTQLILLEESNLAKVSDPAAGSGSVEDLTDQICRAAWKEFQQIESMGGAWAALEQGAIQRSVAEVRAQRQAAVARRSDALVGTSDFPDLTELPVAVEEVAPGETPRQAKRQLAHSREMRFDPLSPFRLGEPFEELRDASDRMLARTGVRPKVFLANIGSASEFGARATFAKNFFETGGIEAPSNDGFSDRERMLAAFARSGAKLACLCSSDEVYAREAIASAQALRAAGASVWLAGQPGALKTELERAGVTRCIFHGCDVLESLRAAHSLVAA